MRFRTLIVALLAVHVGVSVSFAANWITSPSYYSHDPNTGERITQYSPIGPFYIYPRPDFVRSGYRQIRSTLRGGGSADNMHIVEEWGRRVRPYGEWQRPYRPYSVPYSQWGPPYGGLSGYSPYAGGYGQAGNGYGSAGPPSENGHGSEGHANGGYGGRGRGGHEHDRGHGGHDLGGGPSKKAPGGEKHEH